jgi:hypothetical protein
MEDWHKPRGMDRDPAKTVTFNMNTTALIANYPHVYTLRLNDGSVICLNCWSEIAEETDWHDLGKSLRHFNWAETELGERSQ